MTTATDQLLTAALTAAARGWPVFPLRPGTKKPALHGYDRCPRTGPCTAGHLGWEQRATTDPDRIRAAWSAAPYNVGLATGPAGLLVIDLDTPKPGDQGPPAPWDQPGVSTGEDVFLLLCDQAGELPPVDTYTVQTASGGTHLYYQAPPGLRLGNTVGELGWKIDTRGHGGQVVAPGSIVDGRAYRVALDVDPIPLPAWLADRLATPEVPAPAGPVRLPSTDRRSRYLDAVLAAETARVHTAPDGQRNATLYVAAVALGQLVAGGSLTETEARQTLMSAAARHISIRAYSTAQAEKTISSGLRAGAKRKRTVAA